MSPTLTPPPARRWVRVRERCGQCGEHVVAHYDPGEHNAHPVQRFCPTHRFVNLSAQIGARRTSSPWAFSKSSRTALVIAALRQRGFEHEMALAASLEELAAAAKVPLEAPDDGKPAVALISEGAYRVFRLPDGSRVWDALSRHVAGDLGEHAPPDALTEDEAGEAIPLDQPRRNRLAIDRGRGLIVGKYPTDVEGDPSIVVVELRLGGDGVSQWLVATGNEVSFG